MSETTALPPCAVEPAPTVVTNADWIQQYPTWVYRSILAGTATAATTTGPESHRIDVTPIGSIPLPSGRLVACDPYLADDDSAPFVQTVPAGEHPVTVASAVIDTDHRRTFAAVLVVGTASIVRWEMGVTDARPLPEEVGQFVGYPVDAGTGSFLAPEALAALGEAMREDDGMLEDPVSTAMDLSPVEAAVAAPQDGALPVAAFRSGWGDGGYPTWFGYDAAGQPVVVMTDFLLFTDPWTAPEPGPDRAVVPEVAAEYVDPPQEPGPADIYGGVTADEAARILADDRDHPRRRGLWAKLFGRD